MTLLNYTIEPVANVEDLTFELIKTYKDGSKLHYITKPMYRQSFEDCLWFSNDEWRFWISINPQNLSIKK